LQGELQESLGKAAIILNNIRNFKHLSKKTGNSTPGWTGVQLRRAQREKPACTRVHPNTKLYQARCRQTEGKSGILKPMRSTILNPFFCHLTTAGTSRICTVLHVSYLMTQRVQKEHLLPVISSSTICSISWTCKKNNMLKLKGNSCKGFLRK